MRNISLKNSLLFIALGGLSILPIFCTKEHNVTKRKAALDSSHKVSPEVPLDEYKSEDSSLQTSKKFLRSTTANSTTTIYGCGSSLNGTHGTSGYYSYPLYSIDLSSTPYAAHVTVDVSSFDVPNRYSIYDANDQLVAYTGWMGYAMYPGPWGMSLNSPEYENLTFDRLSTTYKLKVETSVGSTSDSWYADVSCATGANISELTDQEIIDIYSNVGVPHNQGLDYVFQGLQNFYGPTYSGGNSKAAHDLMYQNIDSLTIDYLITQLSVDQSDAIACVNNFENSFVTNFGTDLTVNITYSPYYDSLSTQFKTAVGELNTLVHDENKCYTKINYDSIVNNNIALLTNNNEKMYLVSMCSVGYNSVVYWRDNSSKWQNFFGGAILLNPGRDIAVADMAGIVTGAVGGCAYGAVGGSVVLPVIGTIGGCAGVGAVGAVGGGLGNSAKKLVESFFTWLTS